MGSGKIAAVFPGQGTQRTGMGKDFFDNIPASKEVFEEASDALSFDVAKMCFEEDPRINLTEYAQPCILATEIAMYKGLQNMFGFGADYFGGHSLGEYTALTASGAIPFAEAVKIVNTRGKLMQEASPEGVGGMAAVIAPALDVNILQQTLRDFPVDVANINSIDQVVISGQKDCMRDVETSILKLFDNQDGVRFVPLNVSAPFHSRFMATIKDTFRDLLEKLKSKMNSEKATNVTSNFSGTFHDHNSDAVINDLVSQISGTVRWRENMDRLADKVDTVYEIGPNRPLKSFFSTIGVKCKSITTYSSAKREFESK